MRWLAARTFAAMALTVLLGATAMSEERVVEVPGPAGPLQGTLLLAQANAPVVVIVPGSGPTDRDGNNPLGVAASTYRLLAQALAARGINSLRIDKRGMFGSRHAIADPNKVTIGEYADDVRAWARKARAESGTDCAWVLGHSEGGLVALTAGDDKSICGLILVATPGRRFGDVLREQLRSNAANVPLLEPALDAISTLEAGGSVDVGKLDPALLPLFAPAVQGYLRDVMAYDPAKLLGGIDKPVLIVQGARDIQVTPADADRLKGASAHAQLVLLADVNHVLKVIATDDRAANLATYANAALPIAPGVVDAVGTFVLQAPAKR